MPRAASAGPVEDFFALEDQMSIEAEAYAQALEALEKSQGGKAGAAAKPPSDTRPAILVKMDALAKATAGKPDGATIAIGAFMWSWNLDLDLDRLPDRFALAAKHYPDNAELDDILSVAGLAAADAGPAQGWIKALNQVIRTTKRRDAKLGGLVALGQVQLAGHKTSDAKTSFETVHELAPKSDFADTARGFIFEIEHLQVGMVAPDFATTTLAGKELSLKSLRGKAVLLNFWATW